MIKTYKKISWLRKTKFGVATSGGVDSMAIVDFLSRGGFKPYVLFYNHDDHLGYDDAAESRIKDFAYSRNLPFSSSRIFGNKPQGQSLEQWWRNERYTWLKSFDMPVITGHHLGDVVETWIFGAIHGQPKLIPYHSHGFVYRPFLTTKKESFYQWAKNHDVPYIDDPLNEDVHHPRNRIRHNIIPEVKLINPGIEKTIYKKLMEKLKND